MTLKLKIGETAHELELMSLHPDPIVRIAGRDFRLSELAADGASREIGIDGRRLAYRQARHGNTVHLHIDGRNWRVAFVDPRDAAVTHGGGSDEIRAPMPGVVVSVDRQPGDQVKRGDTVLTIESMKLQTNLSAPRDGKLATILKAAGETFDKDQVVATMESEDA